MSDASRGATTSGSGRRRSVARLLAVQALYQIEINKVETSGIAAVDAVIAEFVKHRLGQEIEGENYGEADRALLKGLEARGFRLTYGEDDTGFQMMYLRRGGGYYFNVGCSDMIVDGRIGLLQYDAIERFVPQGVQLRDGTTMPADLVVVATGYESQQEFVRLTLGDAVADVRNR